MRFLRFSGVALTVIAAALLGRSAPAAVKNLVTDADTTIFQNNVNNSAGGALGMFSGTNSSSSPRRALVEFDIADNIPAGSTITNVTLTLYLASVAGGGTTGTATIGLYDLSDSWGEGTAEEGQGASGAGQGAMANTGDATWDDRFYSSSSPTAWTTPGGDYSGTTSGTLAVGTTLNAAYTWGSTSQMVADVQSWLDSPTTNFGWEMINSNETGSQTFRAFYTREEASSNSNLVPDLQITYTPSLAPEPVGIGALAIAAGFVTTRRRRARTAT
jgi:hypothetical protein